MSPRSSVSLLWSRWGLSEVRPASPSGVCIIYPFTVSIFKSIYLHVYQCIYHLINLFLSRSLSVSKIRLFFWKAKSLAYKQCYDSFWILVRFVCVWKFFLYVQRLLTVPVSQNGRPASTLHVYYYRYSAHLCIDIHNHGKKAKYTNRIR